jgi:SAM-dependent methyltransferase
MAEPDIRAGIETTVHSWEQVDCNYCGSSDFEEACFYDGLRFVRCKACGLVFRNPRPRDADNREFYNLDYYARLSEFQDRISAARLAIYRQALSRLDAEITLRPRRLLDIGCGHGHFLKLARDSGWEVEGLELSNSACNYARSKFGIEVANKPIEEANFKSGYFDVVTLWNALDHIFDPAGCLAQVYRILKPGGLLIIRVNNVDTHIFIHRIFMFLKINSKKSRIKDPSVISAYGFNARTLRKMILKPGLREVKVYNSLLSFGDPYRSFKLGFPLPIKFFKFLLGIFFQGWFALTGGRALMSPSIIAYAKK